MIAYVLSPRAAVIEAAERAEIGIVPVGTAADMAPLPPTGPRVVVNDPLDALQVARSLVEAGVEPSDDHCVCVGLGDDSSQSACLVNAALHLAAGRFASFASLERMRNKHRLRELLGTGSRLNGKYCLLDDRSTAVDILKAAPDGVVVKPIDGSGSRSVTRISSVSEFYPIPRPGERLLVEEYFTGPEYSVETITWNGIHHPLVVTEKRIGGRTGFVETGQRQPARLSHDDVVDLHSAAKEVLTAVDYRYGLSHIEFILQEDGPKLVEAHGRVGGDMIADLMRWSIGVSGFEALFRAYRDDVVAQSLTTGVEAGIEFVDLRGWRGSDNDWLHKITAIDGVIEARVLRTREKRADILSSSDRHAHVVMAGHPIDHIIRQINDLRDR